MAKPGNALLVVTLGLALSGCQLTSKPLGSTGTSELASLEAELDRLETLVTATRADLENLSIAQKEGLDAVSTRLGTIDGGVKRVPGLIETACQRPEAATVICEEVAPASVVTNDDKMIVGEVEHLWIDPPGLALTARIDTGSANNSIHALDVTPFERDGDDWVRFNLQKPDESKPADKPLTVERKVVRLMRNSKRPVVRLRVRLGNVLDSFDFILADRSTSTHAVELGRNFLQDVALVDVGKQFVQPRSNSSSKQSDADS